MDLGKNVEVGEENICSCHNKILKVINVLIFSAHE